jgi:hypothetical protein
MRGVGGFRELCFEALELRAEYEPPAFDDARDGVADA